MTKIIYYDYCALMIEVLILVSIFQRGLTRGRVNRWYIATISSITLTTVFDIAGMLLEVKGPKYAVLTYLANAISLWSTAAISVVVCGYLFSRTGIWHVIQKSKIILGIFLTPFIINSIAVIITNPFTHTIFYIDDNGLYARGDGIAILYVLSIVYAYIGSCVVIRYHQIYSLRKIVSIFLLLGSSILSAIIQLIFPNVIIQMFITASACLILLLEVQTPEERIHAGTGLFSLNAYVREVKNMFLLNVEFDVSVVVVTNYRAVIEMLGYFSAEKLISIIANRLRDLMKRLEVDADIYYLGDGRFAAITDWRYKDRNFEIAQGVNGIMLEDAQIGEAIIKIMANVCAVSCPSDIADPEFLLAADEQLSVEVYTGELRYAEKLFDHKSFEIHRDFANIIDRAFEKNYISLEYQPVFSITDNRYIGVEAFLRLNDPKYGYIPPKTVIAEAERYSAIHAITTFEIEEACKFVSDSSFLLTGLEYVEINLSPAQCIWGDLVNIMSTFVKTYNVHPRKICINITDVDDNDMYKKMNENLTELRNLGFGIVMDDFGSGVFEIERIVEMPLMGIKLDKVFVKNGFTKENMNVLKGTIRMISDMGILAGAVGVEDSEMLEELTELGCLRLQGYYYSKPLNKKELLKFMLL